MAMAKLYATASDSQILRQASCPGIVVRSRYPQRDTDECFSSKANPICHFPLAVVSCAALYVDSPPSSRDSNTRLQTTFGVPVAVSECDIFSYSPSGDVTAPAVYANYGRPEDFDALYAAGVSVNGTIVITRYGEGLPVFFCAH